MAEAADKLDINRTARRTIESLQRNWRPLLRPALLYLYLPAALIGALDAADQEFLGGLASLAALVPFAMFAAGLIRLTLADLRAEGISTEEALAAGRRRAWAVLGLYILSGLGIGLGLLLLIVPGVLLALAWCVVGPVLIDEEAPVLQTFGRSAELTRGSRLQIFGLGLILLLIEILASLAVALVSVPFPDLLAAAFIWPAYSAASSVVATVLGVAIYEELRQLKGAGAETPAIAG